MRSPTVSLSIEVLLQPKSKVEEREIKQHYPRLETKSIKTGYLLVRDGWVERSSSYYFTSLIYRDFLLEKQTESER